MLRKSTTDFKPQIWFEVLKDIKINNKKVLPVAHSYGIPIYTIYQIIDAFDKKMAESESVSIEQVEHFVKSRHCRKRVRFLESRRCRSRVSFSKKRNLSLMIFS